MVSEVVSKEQVFQWLDEVPDPEIPVISVVELGVVRDVIFKSEQEVKVIITPTYTGCPAMLRFEQDIEKKLIEKGFEKVSIETVFAPAWTTDWMSEEAREKLRVYGIAPPITGTADKGVLFASGPKVVPCPKCGSKETKLVSQFGATACKAMYSCKDCLEPFEYFKCI
jgi:ring-1,2-phenylacetyl-CoA epoxidase subunit PaaD